MLTKEDLNWLKHLSNSQKIKIIPYDPKTKEIFRKLKKEVQAILGTKVKILHWGASGLGISGQDEIDIVVLVPLNLFAKTVEKITHVFGAPGSYSPDERARFNQKRGKKNIEISIINNNSPRWKRNKAFHNYLQNHPEALEAYQKLKESSVGQGRREYYRQKIAFINNILNKALT